MDELVAILHTCRVRTFFVRTTLVVCIVSATKNNEYNYKAAIPIKMTDEINDDVQKNCTRDIKLLRITESGL
jgi:hypothetical protein